MIGRTQAMRTILRPPLDEAGLRAVAALLGRPVCAVDVGCRQGVRPEWRALGRYGSLVGFDPDPKECARLNAAAVAGQERYEPVALAASPGEKTLYLTADPESSSLYPPSEEAVRRHPELWRHELRGTETIEAATLDSWAQSTDAGPVDALKVDVQGAELDVLRGGEASLTAVRILELEVEFEALYVGQPLFADVDAWVRQHGLSLWRLRNIAHCGLTPARRDEAAFVTGDAVETTRAGGQIAWANAIYVRNELARADAPLGWEVSAQDACLAGMFDLPELVEMALQRAIRTAPAQPRSVLERQLGLVRRRANVRRLHGLFWGAPQHARGFARARLGR